MTSTTTSSSLADAPATTTTSPTVTPVASPSTSSSDSTIGTRDPVATTGVGASANASAPSTGSSPSPSSGDANVANNPGAHDQTKNADNTKINDRDRHGTVTPMSQGNSSSEVKITAAIRRDVMGDKSLSFTAKNVKIITTGTKVTLRGPVNSDQERAAIEAHAKQAAGVTDVDNQIEVKSK